MKLRNKPTIIHNRQDLHTRCGCAPSRWAYKYTHSGVSLFIDEESDCVTVCPYIEGENGETHRAESISFPFLFDDLERLIDDADSEGISYAEGRFGGIDEEGVLFNEAPPYNWNSHWVQARYWLRDPAKEGKYEVRFTEHEKETVLWRGDDKEEYLVMYQVFLRRFLDEVGRYGHPSKLPDMEALEEYLESKGIVLEGTP